MCNHLSLLLLAPFYDCLQSDTVETGEQRHHCHEEMWNRNILQNHIPTLSAGFHFAFAFHSHHMMPPITYMKTGDEDEEGPGAEGGGRRRRFNTFQCFINSP